MIIKNIIQNTPIAKEGIVSIEQLNGGLNNETYKVTTKQRALVVRINGRHNKYLNLTRQSEMIVMEEASLKGYAPKVLISDNPDRFVITEFIEGRMISNEDLNDLGTREQILGHLKKIHKMDIIGRQCSPLNFIERYIDGAEKFQVKIPDGLKPFLKKAEKIDDQRSRDKQYNGRFCHNDYFTVNMIKSGPQIYVIDWEMSGIGDVFFDLATIPFSCRFSEIQEKEWLRSYFETYDDEQYEILQDLKLMHMVRECAWGLFHSGIKENKVNHDFDYYKHMLYVLERLQQGIIYL
jgi:thiamine kinase-like enzyme